MACLILIKDKLADIIAIASEKFKSIPSIIKPFLIYSVIY
jgi:hypothetical protein